MATKMTEDFAPTPPVDRLAQEKAAIKEGRIPIGRGGGKPEYLVVGERVYLSHRGKGFRPTHQRQWEVVGLSPEYPQNLVTIRERKTGKTLEVGMDYLWRWTKPEPPNSPKQPALH